MADHTPTFTFLRATCELFAKQYETSVAGSINEATTLQAIVGAPSQAADDMRVVGLINACEDACGVKLTRAAQNRAVTVRLLIDAIMGAENANKPLAAPLETTDAKAGGFALQSMIIAIDWTGDCHGNIGIGATRNEAEAALIRSFPDISRERLSNLDFTIAEPTKDGGWSAQFND